MKLHHSKKPLAPYPSDANIPQRHLSSIEREKIHNLNEVSVLEILVIDMFRFVVDFKGNRV